MCELQNTTYTNDMLENVAERYHETYKNIRTFNKKNKKRNGRVENRTLDLLLARQALYQLSYTPFLLKIK